MKVILTGGSGRADRYAVRELTEVGHDAFLIAAADTCSDIPIREAIERHYGPGANYTPDDGDYPSAFDCREIERFCGWKPSHSWRTDSPAGQQRREV
jgi:hypothetical protein